MLWTGLLCWKNYPSHTTRVGIQDVPKLLSFHPILPRMGMQDVPKLSLNGKYTPSPDGIAIPESCSLPSEPGRNTGCSGWDGGLHSMASWWWECHVFLKKFQSNVNQKATYMLNYCGVALESEITPCICSSYVCCAWGSLTERRTSYS